MRYFYICDACGDLSHIAEAPIPDDETWACGKCGSLRLWEFTNRAKAIAHSRHIQRIVASGLFRRVGQ